MNKALISGRLARDPELRQSSGNGTSVCTFTMAVKRSYKRDGQPDADFIPCVAFAKRAETVAKYLRKGSQAIVEGSIQVRSYEKDGTKRYATEIICDNVEFIGKKSDGETSRAKGQPQQQSNAPTEVDDEDMPF